MDNNQRTIQRNVRSPEEAKLITNTADRIIKDNQEALQKLAEGSDD